MVREDLGTAREQGWTDTHIAAYFVASLKENEIGESGRRFMRDYFEARAEEDGWHPDLTDVAAHYQGQDVDVSWDRLEDDLADYVADERNRILNGHYADRDTPRGDAATAAAVEEQVERIESGPFCADEEDAWRVEAQITPGYVDVEDAVGDVAGASMHVTYEPDDARDVWLTSVYTSACDTHDGEEAVHLDYMDEDLARDTVGWMLDQQRLDRVHDLLEKCFRRGHREQAAGFLAEMLDAGHLLDAVAEVEQAARGGQVPDPDAFVDAVYAEDPAGAASFRQMIDSDTEHEV